MSAGPPPQYPSYPGDGGQPGFPYGPRADQRQATTALVLGILGLVICGLLAPFAWSIGRKSMQEIDASGGALGGRGKAQAGYIMGIIGTVLLAVAVLGFLLLVAVGSSFDTSM
jgi:TRAP-type C4-dicarboxylate transport system permease small subunit